MPKIELLVGHIASGKSTYARGRAREGAIIVDHDAIVQGIHGEYRYDPDLHDLYHAAEERIAEVALNAGRDVVVDRTHFKRRSRERWVDFARMLGRNTGTWPEVHAVVFPCYTPEYHRLARYTDDPRGLSLEKWISVARAHEQQRLAEPLDAEAEGFASASMRPGFLKIEPNWALEGANA